MIRQNANVTPIPVYLSPAVDGSDEFTLVDLWQVIVRRKGIILLSFLASLGLAATYIMLVDPVYRAKAYLLPPQQQDIQGLILNYRGDEEAMKQYSPLAVYQLFLGNFKSRGLRREFFDAHNLLERYASGIDDANIEQVFDSRYNQNIQLRVDKNNSGFVTVSFSDSDPKFAAQLLNQFIDFVNGRTVQQLSDNVTIGIQAEIERIRYHLNSKSKLAGQRRLDTIAKLEEALQIAEALGIERPIAPRVAVGKSSAEVAVNTADLPLYTRGVKALKAEITILKSRKSDEFFIAGLRDLQEKLTYLQGLSIDREKLATVTVDSKAAIPYQAEKPRKSTITLLGVVLGILASIFLVFVAELMSRVRRG